MTSWNLASDVIDQQPCLAISSSCTDACDLSDLPLEKVSGGAKCIHGEPSMVEYEVL
jgi:hypothetical protein